MITPIIVPMEVSASDAEIPMSVDAAYSVQSGGGVPEGGLAGDLLAKRSNGDFDVEWITPANSVEQDNTRPITAAAVYTEVGNINALLATI